MNSPLAERLRPKTIHEFIGQEHLLGQKGALKQILSNKTLPSLLFWGSPGIGKTSLAHIIANELNLPIYTLSAINSGVKDIRSVIDSAKRGGGMFSANTPILFIDEIHRFSKSQQDSLLEAVEKGWVTLIGATTENPSFEVISALLSRCQVYTLQPLNKSHLEALLERALTTDQVLSRLAITIESNDALLRLSGGDARKLLNILELVVNYLKAEKEIVITNDIVYKVIQQTPLKYDKSGEQHYDIISAFIKSIRGSDPNAAVYWLARMLEGGEDIKFIGRRLIILASEDIGLANPTALVMANNTFQAITTVGMPEARIILSQCVLYLATSPKSNSAYMAINNALTIVKDTGNLEVPLHIRNAPTTLMKEIGYGKNYKYAHDFEGNFVFQEFMPEEIKNKSIYKPSHNKREEQLKHRLSLQWKDKYDF